MPRFFFDFDEGDRRTRDIDGHELPTVKLASDEAINALLEIVRSKQPEDRRQAIACHLRDETGHAVCSVTLILRSDQHRPTDVGLGQADQRIPAQPSCGSPG